MLVVNHRKVQDVQERQAFLRGEGAEQTKKGIGPRFETPTIFFLLAFTLVTAWALVRWSALHSSNAPSLGQNQSVKWSSSVSPISLPPTSTLDLLVPTAASPKAPTGKTGLAKSIGSCDAFYPRTVRDRVEMNDVMRSLSFDTVNRYVMFFGFPRSGHSWIGAALDASPDAMIANEWDALKRYWKNSSLTQTKLFAGLAENSYLCGKYGRFQVYDYSIPGLWQGKVRSEKLHVIGDKKGGGATKVMLKVSGSSPWKDRDAAQRQKEFFDDFLSVVGVEPRIIVVLRNPFDLIATNTLRKVHKRGKRRNVDNMTIEYTLNRISDVLWAKENLAQPHQWHVLTMERFAVNTREEMVSLCRFSGINCPEVMLAAIENMTKHEVHKTSTLVRWSEWQRKRVNKYIQEHLAIHYDT